VDHYTHPEIGANSARDGSRAAVVVTILVGALVALSIAGSALWRPPSLPDTTLELGRAELVSFSGAAPNETIPRVLEFVGPTVGFLIVAIDEEGDERRPILRSGSGFVVHEAGFMITNAHVVEEATSVTVTFASGAEYEAEVYGIHPQTDLAVVKLDTDEPLPVAALGDSDALRVGEFVLALGAPFGYQESATSGIVSGLHRSGLGIARYEDFILTDAPINRGNSGGPLVNLRGEVVGINTAIIADDDSRPGRGTFAGVGFAIPMNVARVVARNLIGDGGLTSAGNVDPAAVGDATEVGAGRDDGALRTGSMSTDLGQAAEGPTAAVAQVRAIDANGRDLHVGSGFCILDGDALVLVTNAHVVSGADRIEATFPGGVALVGEVVHDDPRIDLAIVRLMSDEVLPVLGLGSSSGLALQDPIRALGARGSRVVEVEGVVTRLPVQGAPVPERFVETSAPTVRGDSGGPLLGADGLVVGVLVARDDDARSGSAGRRSYAIPVDDVRLVLADAAAPDVDTAELGFSGPVSRTGRGITVTNLVAGGAAEAAGLRDEDYIIAADGEVFGDYAGAYAWLTALRAMPDGQRVTLTVRRRASERSTEVEEIDIVYTVRNR